MTQPGYVNSMMMPNYLSSAGPMPMNANCGWPEQQVFPQMPQQNHQVTGFQQGQIYPGFQTQGVANQPMNLGQQVGGQQIGGQQFGGQHLGGQQLGGQQVGG